jgi:small subunit ribosomal protein S1
MAKDTGGFAGMFAEYERDASRKKGRGGPRVGDEISGTVVKIGAESVFVDLGAKAEGMIDKAELTDPEGKLRVAVGDRLRAFVVAQRDGQIILGTRLGGKAQKGDEPGAEIARAFDHGIPVVGKVKAVNKGGVEVEVGAVTAFCPISQLDLQRIDDATGYVGRELEFRVTKFEGGRGDRPNVLLSRRMLLEAERSAKAAEIVSKLEVGAVVRGKVTRVQPFGAFVDIGGVEGLVHKSELGISRTANPANVLAVGAELEVVVVKIEPSGDPKKPDRIGLSLKQMAEKREADDAKSYQRPAAQSLGTLADVLGKLKK